MNHFGQSDERTRRTLLRMAALGFCGPVCPVTAATAPVQNFIEHPPSEISPGPFVISGRVVHRALDGSWIQLDADSRRGSFSYLIIRQDAAARDAVAGRNTAWKQLRAGSDSKVWLEGDLSAVRKSGSELEGTFAFQGETVRLHFELIVNNPIGSDPSPALANVPYGPHERNMLDVYPAKAASLSPVAVYIPGGAWQKGDKSGLTGHHALLNAGISVVAVNYRYIPSANPSGSEPAVAVPLRDAARALQFIRSRAAKWGFRKDRVAAWGISAGAFSALWLATHRDMADPSSSDPVSRESTRPSCASGIYAQTTLDPEQMRGWVGPELKYGPHAFGLAARDGFPAFLAARERLIPWIRTYSPAALLSRGSAPSFLDYRIFSLNPCEPLDAYYTHSPQFGIGFQKLAKLVDVECRLRYEGSEDNAFRNWEQFLTAKLVGLSGSA